ncbi:MAG TPA: HD domain-containing phosphohydrolase [bacterium]|nr:HD domain-containing phosphohydrolase [bacterium]
MSRAGSRTAQKHAVDPGPAAPVDPRILRHILEIQEEGLQLADSLERVLDLVRRTVSSAPGVGTGAVYLIEGAEPRRVATIDGPESARLSANDIDLAALARRALQSSEIAQQGESSATPAVAHLLRSAHGPEAAVAVAGDLAPFERFFSHAGAAIARERARTNDRSVQAEAIRRAEAFERCAEILDGLAVQEDPELMALRIAGAAACSCRGFGEISFWTIRAEDRAPVKIASAGSARGNFDFSRALSFQDWIEGLPRWGGAAWIRDSLNRNIRPTPNDFLLAPMRAEAPDSLLGFLLAEVIQPLEDSWPAEDLLRWSALGRLALLQRSGRRRSQDHLDELRAQKDREAESYRMKSQLIAAVSHELRTPLTSIRAYAETLRKPQVSAEAATRDRFLQIIHDESRRLTRIVDDILDLATLEGGRVRLTMRRVDLARALHDAVDVIRPIASERGVTIRCDVRGEIPVQADPDLLEQLAVNLLENAVKFSEHGGEVRLGVERERTTCRVYVEDDGPGIPADKLDRIFEQFYQVEGAQARRHGGAGLGLAICKSITLWHDGRIWVESEEGRGARFVVSLPRVRARTSPGEAKQSNDVPRDLVLELVVEMVAEIMDVETVSLSRRDSGGDELVLKVARAEHAGVTAAENREISAPIRLQGNTIGFLHASEKVNNVPFDDHDARLLELLAERTALVLQKLQEVGDSPEVMRNLERALRAVIDVRRHYDGGELGSLVLAVCERLKISPEETARIHYAAMVRDVGMTRIPFGVTKKPAMLTARDRALLERHPEEGARMLRPIEFQQDVFDIVLAHHEEPAGSGYPRGIRRDAIPLGARILAVVDAYAAMRAGRPYRLRASHEEALAELHRHLGRQFDPEVVEALEAAVAARETLSRDRREAGSGMGNSSPQEQS